MLARYFRSMKVGSLVLVVGLLSVAGVLLAQGQTAPAKSVGGQGAATKLTPDGQPDIQGIWRANPGGDTYDLAGNAGPRPDYNLQGNGTPRPPTRRVVDPPDGNIPYQPWAAAKEKGHAEPHGQSYEAGIRGYSGPLLTGRPRPCLYTFGFSNRSVSRIRIVSHRGKRRKSNRTPRWPAAPRFRHQALAGRLTRALGRQHAGD